LACIQANSKHKPIKRLKDQKGFAEFQEGFRIYPYELNQDHWTEGFIVDRATPVPSCLDTGHTIKN